jgi:hypothetical protein
MAASRKFQEMSLYGFLYFILSAFRDPEPYQPVMSCTGFEMVDGVLTPITDNEDIS